MDIWRWVHGREEALREDGHTELAEYIDNISTHTVNDRFDLVDQVYHAALPLCQALDDKWLEIYFRHWRLQAHVLKNYDARGNLHEAISLLDFAHQEETKDCPQRICAVQDLASCYGIKDGPGFSEERISVCRETLAQIDGSWPCYECVSSELLDALIDAKNYKQAEIELHKIDAEVSKFQGDPDGDRILTRTRLLLETGRVEAAWSMIKDAKNPYGGDGFVRHVELLKSLTLCRMGRWEEAKTTCLDYDEIVLAATYYDDWTKIQILLQAQGLVENSRELRRNFHRLLERLLAKDALRIAFQIGERLIGLCQSAKERLRAVTVIQTMAEIIPNLHRDLGATETLNALKTMVAEIEEPVLGPVFETVEDFLEYQFETETQENLAIDAALKKWPEDGQLYTRKSDIFLSHFQKDEAYVFLETAYKTHRGSAALESRFGSAFLAKHGFEAYEAEFPLDKLDGLTAGAIWNRGFNYVSQYESRNPEKALTYLKIIESHWPEDVWLLGRIARQAVKVGNYDEAISYRRKQIEYDGDNRNHKWDLLVTATLQQDVALICEMAKALEIELNDEGLYPEGKRGSMRIQWEGLSGNIETYHATRLGPALARISSIRRIDKPPQIYGRHVVFDPAPLNRLDQEDDEGYRCDIDGNYNLLYPPPLLTVHDPAYRTYTVDGVRPSDASLETLSARINAAGFIYNVWSPDAYVLSWKDGETERTNPAIYIYILVKPGDEGRLNSILKEFNKTLEHPLIWTELTKFLEDTPQRLQQDAIIARYGIEP